MTTILSVSRNGDTLTEQQRRLCIHNIEACKAFRENPSPQPDYKAKPLMAPRPVKRSSARKVAKFAAHIEAKYGRTYEPESVRLTSIAPCPPNSAKPS